MKGRLTFIAKKENMNITDGGIDMVYNSTNGDMRKAITLLQHLNYLNKEIDIIDVCKMACIVPNEILEEIINICTDMGEGAMRIANLTNKLIMDGYPLTNILEQLIKKLIDSENLTDKMKSIICLHISNTEYRLTGGADEYMQLLSVFMCIKNVSNGLVSVYSIS
jgi:replication factor C subunit 2/4